MTILLWFFFFGPLFIGVALLISQFFVIIVIFTFFVSFLTSYIFSPIYLCLTNNWIEFAAALLQTIVLSPFCAFFIFFLINAIRSLGSALEALFLSFPFFGTLLKQLEKDLTDPSSDCCEQTGFGCCATFILILISALFYAVGGGFLYLPLLHKFALLPAGVFFFLPTLCLAIALFIPIYRKYFVTLFCGSNKDETCIETCVGSVVNFIREIHVVEPQTTDISESSENMSAEAENILLKMAQAALSPWQIPLYDHGKQIEDNAEPHSFARGLSIWIFTVLNLIVIGYDCYRLSQEMNYYFLASTIIRFVLTPLFSYFNIFTSFRYKPKDRTFRITIYIANIFTVVVTLIIIGCISFRSIYQSNVRIQDLNYTTFDGNEYPSASNLKDHPLCILNFYDVSAIEAYGYALGGYDVIDNPPVFVNQMKTFFGPDYASHITYEVYNLTDSFPFIIYHDHLINTTIVSFRGFNTGIELSFILEMFVNQYVIPFFTDNVPFLNIFTSFWLEDEMKIAHRIGKYMFDPTYLFKDYVDQIVEICREKKLDVEKRVLFTGVNVGGNFAKIVGIQLKKYSLAFLTLPIFNEFNRDTFEFEAEDMTYVTNVYTYESFFTLPESETATNIGVFPLKYTKYDKWCKSDICRYSIQRESIYPSICYFSEICGHGHQLENYCKQVIGKDKFDDIRDYVQGF